MVYLIRRFVAIYIDSLIAFVLTTMVYTIGQICIGIKISEIQTPSSDDMLLLELFILFLYFCLAEFFLNRTLGKKLLKLEIRGYEESKGKVRLKQVLIRNLVRLIPIEPFSIFLNEEHRMWHDMASKTSVIDVRKKKYTRPQ